MFYVHMALDKKKKILLAMAISNTTYTFSSSLRSILSLSASSSVSSHATAYYSSPFLLTGSLYSFAIPLFCKL